MIKKILTFSLLVLIIASCDSEEHFLTDKNYRKQVIVDFEKVKELAINRSEALFKVFDNSLSLKEEEALKFLFAYMPLSDLADYNGDFFLSQVKLAFKAKETFSWGNTIPEDIFRHYVLPYRVNNENLDTARSVFFKELKERLNGLSLEEAAIEVNRWCHEKVIYQSTDDRTISPLNAVKSAYGRCGEQSTFTVTALRAACIPARQCYTPRWAHSDDNHAWVEVWINGKWRYLGACEPEVKLDVAWFSEPVLRAMLVHTKAFGRYKGDEKTDQQYTKYAYLNLLEHYAPVKELVVRVSDKDGNPVRDAEVEYQLYNYAEFYPLSKQISDNKGICKFTTGYGDLMIWANKGDNYAYQKINVEKTDTVYISLDKKYSLPYTEQFHIFPPKKGETGQVLTDDEKAFNDVCKLHGDSLRNRYVASFISETQAYTLADSLKTDRSKTWEILKLSRGNYPEIVKYLKEAVKVKPDYAVKLLEIISKKDLRDVTSEILLGTLAHAPKYVPGFENEQFYLDYVLNPRVVNEKLVNFMGFLSDKFKKAEISDANKLIDWIKKELLIDNENNYYLVPLSPVGVYELRVCDALSRDIFFVLGCRTLGIPSRLEPGTGIPQYYIGKKWNDAVFEPDQEINRAKGFINLVKDNKMTIDPLYRIHFSLIKIDNGKPLTLDYGWEKPLTKLGNTFSVDTGNYLLLTGNRQTDGSVITNLSFFSVGLNDTTHVTLQLKDHLNEINPITSYSEPILLKNSKGEILKLGSQMPCVMVWLDVNTEPGKHALRNIQQLKNELSNSGILFNFIVHEINQANRELLKNYQLPLDSRLMVDSGFKTLEKMKKATGLKSENLPVIIFLHNNEIYYYSTGYNIGVGEQILKLNEKLKLQ